MELLRDTKKMKMIRRDLQSIGWVDANMSKDRQWIEFVTNDSVKALFELSK
jgi:hypothetical protein